MITYEEMNIKTQETNVNTLVGDLDKLFDLCLLFFLSWWPIKQEFSVRWITKQNPTLTCMASNAICFPNPFITK